MVDTGSSLLDVPALAVTLIVGATVLIIVYVSSLFRAAAPEETKTGAPANAPAKKEKQEKQHTSSEHKGGKKKQQHAEKWSRDASKQFSHPWLLTSLKGHSGQILDMDFSSNGKFLATCADDQPSSGVDPGGGGGGDCNDGVPEVIADAVSACSTTSSSSSSSSSSLSSSGSSSGTNSSSEANKENASPKPAGARSGLSRRQRKNRSRREDASPPSAGAGGGNGNGGGGGVAVAPAARKARGKARRQAERGAPLRQHAKLNLTDYHLQTFMRHYLLGPEQLLGLGYPVESSLWPGRAIIYKAAGASRVGVDPDPDPAPPPAVTFTNFDVNAREFVPGARHCSVLADANANLVAPVAVVASPLQPARRLDDLPAGMDYSAIGAEWAARHADGNSASGSASQDSPPSPSSASDVDGCEELCSMLTPTAAAFHPAHHEDRAALSESKERKCVRCGRGFFVTDDGEYLTQERCLYHWGKLQAAGRGRAEYSCCKGRPTSRGCSVARLHVWVGVREGVNGPLDGFVRTRPRKSPPPDGNYGVYALDCEMCFTTQGLELAKVTVVAADGRLVYDSFVKPDNYIVDYNTRFSGITARDLARKGASKALKEVQNDLMGFINSDTVLVGHGLENDLRALRIIHGTVVDTSVVFPHYYGLPYRRSLKSLVGCLLKRDIQKNANGHDSFEDARACIELMLWRVRKDFRGMLGK